MSLTHKEAFSLLQKIDNILILTHRNPDGDAVGSMFALYHLLKAMGKNVRCEIDTVTDSLAFAVSEAAFCDFSEDYVISVDLADNKLLTDDQYSLYGDRIFLAIDHHEKSKPYSRHLLLDFKAAAACEVIYDMISENGISDISPEIANALYLGLSTDTGCFRYPNTSAHTFYAASRLVEAGADSGEINRRVFETKSWNYVRFETMAMNSMKTYFDGKCAVLVITQDMYKKTGVSEADTHGIAALPRQIEGVLAGVVVKERTDGTIKISVRSNDPVNASEICEIFGGGGHRLAAGCDYMGTVSEAVNAILKVIGDVLEDI